MDKCREEFELFWTARCCVIGIECVLTRLINGDYYDIKAYYAWIGWKESRESMQAIKLPDIKTESLNSKETGMVEHVSLSYKLAITSAGCEVE